MLFLQTFLKISVNFSFVRFRFATLRASISWGWSLRTLQKNIFHIQVSLFTFFATPPKKSETATANRWATTTNSKPPERIIMMGQSDSLSNSQIMFITLFSKCSHS
jgi:hypothetical protein